MTPLRLVSIMKSQSSMACCHGLSTGVFLQVPALLTSTAIPPIPDAFDTTLSTSSRFETSATIPVTPGTSKTSFLTSKPRTAHPSSASRIANARPRPCAAPLTIATFPERLMMILRPEPARPRHRRDHAQAPTEQDDPCRS